VQRARALPISWAIPINRTISHVGPASLRPLAFAFAPVTWA